MSIGWVFLLLSWCFSQVFGQETRIGVYFGSFDPVHNAHVAFVESALNLAGHPSVGHPGFGHGHVDHVVLVPSGPGSRRFDKSTWRLSVPARLLALHLRFGSDPRVKVSHLKLNPEASPYTADMLDEMKALWAQHHTTPARWVLMGGDDLFETVPKYHRADEILNDYDWLIRRRKRPDGFPDFLKARGFRPSESGSDLPDVWIGPRGNRLQWLPPDGQEVSSSQIDRELGTQPFRFFLHTRQPIHGWEGPGFVRVFDDGHEPWIAQDPHGLVPHLHLDASTRQAVAARDGRHHLLLTLDEAAQNSWGEITVSQLGALLQKLDLIGQSRGGMATHWDLLDGLALLFGCEEALRPTFP